MFAYAPFKKRNVSDLRRVHKHFCQHLYPMSSDGSPRMEVYAFSHGFSCVHLYFCALLDFATLGNYSYIVRYNLQTRRNFFNSVKPRYKCRKSLSSCSNRAPSRLAFVFAFCFWGGGLIEMVSNSDGECYSRIHGMHWSLSDEIKGICGI